jgi:hypothetical protein
MMTLQKYQFELRDCSYIFSCHKEAGISLAKKNKSFKFIVATDVFRLLLLRSGCLPATQSSNRCHDVGGPLLLGV